PDPVTEIAILEIHEIVLVEGTPSPVNSLLTHHHAAAGKGVYCCRFMLTDMDRIVFVEIGRSREKLIDTRSLEQGHRKGGEGFFGIRGKLSFAVDQPGADTTCIRMRIHIGQG